MIGYLRAHLKGRSREERQLYRSVYCGLCHALKKGYGGRSALCVNYEMTALLLLLLSMEEERPRIFHGCCSFSPVLLVPYVDFLEERFSLASALTVFVAEQEVRDNLQDEHRFRWTVADHLMRRKFRIARESLDSRLPEGSEGLVRAIQSYYDLERKPEAVLEDLLEECGAMTVSLAEPLFAGYEAEPRGYLLRLAHALGRWIYLMDACDDLARDRAAGQFNPLLSLADCRAPFRITEEILEEVRTCVDHLPVKHEKGLIDHLFGESMGQTARSILSQYESECGK